MKMASPTAREQRLLAILILLGVVLLLSIAIVMPLYQGFIDRAEQREMLRLQAQHYERTIASIPRLRRISEASRNAVRDFTMAAPTPDRGGVQLEERLHAGVRAVGGEFHASDHEGSDKHMLRARATARMTLPQLTSLLVLLQNDRPYLVIESLNITADDALVSQKAGPLDVKMEISIPFAVAQSR
jgi:Type II secretion system (T2SS), protein M subtype b